MTPKTAYYAAMAEDAARQVTGSRERWTSFLATAGRLYKYPYHEQLMIHAQRPDATACAEYDLWNEKMNRYVKRGSKGIALLDTRGDRPRLRYVFDVSDTGTRRNSRPVTLWKVQDEHIQPIQDALEKAYGVLAVGHSLETQIDEVARQLATEYWNDNARQISDIVANSYLEGYDEYNIGASFRNAATISIAYTLYSRCVDNPDDYFEHEDFLDIFDFNTRQTANALGTAVSEMSYQVFREIEVTIRNYERSKQAERSQNNDERNDLQTERGLLHPEPGTDRDRSEAAGQVWQNEESIPGAEQQDSVQRPDPDREVVPPSEGDRRDSDPQSGAADEPVSAEQSGTGQRDSADGVGSAHEQPESTGRGNRDDGAYQQLSLNLFLSEAEQISFIDEAESRKPSAFSISQEQIDHFLILGSNTDNHRMMVALEYAKGKTTEEIAQRLKEIYRGSNGLRLDGTDITAWFDDQCIHLAKGKTARFAPSKQIVSWQEAAERIGQLLENGEYATNVELVEALGYERQKLAESLWYLYRDFADGVRDTGLLGSMQFIRSNGFPSETAELAEKLADPEFRANLQNEYRMFMEIRKEHPEILRFNYHKLDNIEKRLNELDLPLREYHTDRMVPPLVGQFITDDELNQALASRGSGFAGGKGRIWNYWQEGHSSQEKAEFLKKEHGTGGHSHALSGANGSGEDHDAKGMRFRKAGCEEVKFSWSQVASRIDSLIANDRYLTEQEKAERDAILEAKAEPEIEVEEETPRYTAELTSDAFESPFIIYDNKRDTYYEAPDGFYRSFDSESEAKEFANQLNELEERPALDRAKELIDQFCKAEYDSPADFSDLSQVGIGHTTVTDDEIPIQCYANLVDFRIERYLGETLIESRQSNSLEELIAHELENLDFSDLIYVTDEEVERYYEAESAWNYKVGDTVYLDDTAFLVEEIRDSEVQLRDPTLLYPIFRAENRSRFEEMLSRDERNDVLRKNTADEQEAVTEENQGEISPEIAQEPDPHRYLVAAYHHFENGFDDKLDYQTLAEAEKAAQGYVDGTMEYDGFKYDGAAVYDQQEHKYLRIYGDYPDEKAHAQVKAFAETEQEQMQFTTETVTTYPAEETNLPYDVVIQKLRVEPENFIDHFYVVDDLEVRGALSLKEYSTFEDALRAYHELPNTQMKALGAMNTARPFPGSLDFMQCREGQDTIVEDYKKVAGWEHPEVQEVISKIETAIQTKAVPEVPASNYHITDDHIGEGGPKQKFARNIEAIETLFQLERDNRNATPEEQEVLASYVGWGGLADAFDPDKGNWSQEYTTLKNLLSEDEYAAARASTLNAHYTSPTVIRAIYDAVAQMGFETGNILEPSMGIGNFFGMLPPEMQSSQLYGVELDSITGRIAQKLYPNAEIKVAGFETTDRRDFYDLAVGNVPFGNYKVADKPYDKLGFSIHN